MYRNRERGFSLLEIMVSLAVLGILAAVAAAGFREYVVRAAVSEGFGFADAARTGVIESLAMGAAPSSAAMSGGGVAGHRTSVDWHPASAPPGLKGYLLASAELPLMGQKKAFALELREGGNWYCVEAGPYAAADEALPPRFLPAICRDGGAMPSAAARTAGCGPDEDPLSITGPGGASVAACAPKCPPGHSRAAGGGAVCHPDPAPVPAAPSTAVPSPSAAATAAPAVTAAPASPAALACPPGQFRAADRQTGLPTGACRDWNYGGGGWQAPAPDAPCDLGPPMPAPDKDAVFQSMTCDPLADHPDLCGALPPDPAADPAWVKTCKPGELPFARVTNRLEGTQDLERGCMSRSECRNYKNDMSEEHCQQHSMSSATTADYLCTYCCVGDGCNGGDPAGGGCAVKPGTIVMFED